jgi:capsular exopolysaccharide synthesis family protein
MPIGAPDRESVFPVNSTSSAPPAQPAPHYATVIARHRLTIAALTVAVTALGLWQATIVATPTYTSRAKVLVRPISDAVTPAASRMVAMGTEREIATSATVAAIVKERLQSIEPVQRLQRRISVSVVGSTQFLDVTCRDRTRPSAQRCAQAAAEAYLVQKAQDAAKARDLRIANANAALGPINAEIVEATRRVASNLVDSPAAVEAELTLRRLQDEAKPYRQILADMATLNVNDVGAIVTPADLPSGPPSPDPRTHAAVGALVGLGLGLLIAFGRDRLDDRLRGRVELEEYLRAPVLATVPRTRGNGRTARPLVITHDPNGPASEAYRALRTRLLVMAERRPLQTLMVASPTGDEGKTAVAANLAASLTQVGKRVVLLSADLRGSNLHHYFGLHNERGLSSVLAGEIPPWEAVQEPVGFERLWVFSSGPVPAHPAELIQSDLLRELLAERRKVADFVIIEAPAAIGASESVTLAPLVDGIVVVADARNTGRDQVGQIRSQFDQVGGLVVGAVMSNAANSRTR